MTKRHKTEILPSLPALQSYGHAADRARVSVKGVFLRSGFRVPDFDHFVAAAADDPFAVAAEGHTTDKVLMSAEG